MKNSINNILVYRQLIGPQTTLGQCYLNGEYMGYTCEDTLRPDRIKLKHETAIEEGAYYGKKYISNTFGECLAIDDVPGFTHIRVHGGNNHRDTSGCILLGTNRDKKSFTVDDCRPAMDNLLAKIDDNKPILFTIINQIGIK